MKITTGFHVYSKDVPFRSCLLRGFSCNVFAMTQGHETWLVDAGSGLVGRPRKIVASMQEEGLDPSSITRILLTHAHPDHAGGIGYFSHKCNPAICIHESEEASLKGGTKHLWESEAIAARGKINDFYPAPMWLVHSFARYSIGNTPSVSNIKLLKDRETIKGHEHDVVVIHTPGHIPGHACYYVPDAKIAFIGDLIDPSFDRKASLNFPSSDYDQICHSIQVMRELDIEFLCAAHASDVIHGASKIRDLFTGTLEVLRNARETTLAMLKERGPMRLKEFAGHYPKDTWRLQDQVCVPFAVIKSLEKEGRVKAENGRYRLIETGIS
ncbi:MAG: MBL fold metallo-hydrolase [Candidatus Lokiarchaeota archaeon]|nr:MBL fold metallo-hydrolase [Candidatus Lokiarchaeota archaeon]